LSICEDIWHPQPAAQAKAAGAQCLLNLNASPFHLGKHAERAAVVRARATETGLPVVYLNLTGGQDELVFDGDSFVCDAQGRIGQRLPAFEEALAAVDLPQPEMAAAPVEAAPEASLYAALRLGVHDYVRKNGFPGVLLGLSGGVDSALVLCLAADALGAAQVTAVLMPSRYTAGMSNEDALLQTAVLGVAHHLIPIEPAFHTLLDMLAGPFAGAAPDVTEENLQSRIRGLLLMALSNKTGRLLLSTGNKSEMATGYATLYGDMNGGFAPLKDVSKTWVYRLARWRNAQGAAPMIPERVLTRAPSAELRPDQTDQDSLPDYDLLDRILEGFVEQDESVERLIAQGLPEKEVRRVAALILRNEYKRRQAPPGVRVTRRAFGRDRRYPITSGYR
jgi:NAD+ synthase (glutamine-hydrolysing)